MVFKTENINLDKVQVLLKDNNLPFEDIISSKVDFIVAEEQENILGCIGVEKYQEHVLLRSFAVADNYKGEGIGKELLLAMFEKSKEEDVQKIHLLTTTAEKYFKKYGFEICDRKEAPQSILKTKEFSEICPSSSAYMTKIL